MTTEEFDKNRARLIAIAEREGPDQYAYTGSETALGFTHRADDLSVVWTGDSVFIVIPIAGPIFTTDCLEDRSELGHVIEDMCASAHSMLRLVAHQYRRNVAKTWPGIAA
ncbi:hypothetical protein NS365_05610 [Aureimonas ureilytica]|uniref:Uncharacterized protein n=1 Tax=Aureimonas ureilytica TaxID=401562 RepID=A0A175RVP2_9HYPH|nr:hypothetical protein [Aureimonas ureilytica]KTR06909.1 hypothetical protein NS365_05610 [Aureimonas ureilytica]